MGPEQFLIASVITTIGATVESQRQQKAARDDQKEAREVEAAAARARSRSARMAQIRRAQKARARALNLSESAGVGASSFAIAAAQDPTQVAASNIGELETQRRFGETSSAHMQDAADRMGNASQAQAVQQIGSIGVSIFADAYQPKTT